MKNLAILAMCLSLAIELTSAHAAAPTVPAGSYTVDRAHATLLFRVNHLGFSNYTAHLTASSVKVTVDADSLETDFPDPLKLDFNAQLRGAEWLDTAKYPQMAYVSKRVVSSDRSTVRIDGELTLRRSNHRGAVQRSATRRSARSQTVMRQHGRRGASHVQNDFR
jgi:polyisoprenoid-binding protein YceI